MPGLDPGIHLDVTQNEEKMRGSSPRMTVLGTENPS
jgi:hypothetical protein